jgi:hypothetical protein
MDDKLPTAPTRQSIEAKGRSAPGRVTGKLRIAIAEMVWSGDKRAQAAEKAGLRDHSLREALKKPHVKQAYLQELETLRTSERARNIHAAVDVRDNSENQAARIHAAKFIENPTGECHGGVIVNVGLPQAGYVIDISNGPEEREMRIVGPTPSAAPAPKVIEHEPEDADK